MVMHAYLAFVASRLSLSIAADAGDKSRLVPSVVLVTTFPPEYEQWEKRLPLDEKLPFPSGAGELFLGWNARLRVLGIVTGITSKRAALSVTALGHDSRFDLREATWVLAGIAGVDPLAGTVGGVTWARHLVDGTSVKFIDPREAPRIWPTGWLPEKRKQPFGLPMPSMSERSEMVWDLSENLVNWAYHLTRNIELPDSTLLQRVRQTYATSFPAAARSPEVKLGVSLSTDVFWGGALSASWARNWTTYWISPRSSTDTDRSGVMFAASAMEDFGVAEALSALSRGGHTRSPQEALLVLRAASNFVEPSGLETAVQYMDSPDHLILAPACEAAFLVGSRVVRGLVASSSSPGDQGMIRTELDEVEHQTILHE